jgi:chromosome segregation ATPase
VHLHRAADGNQERVVIVNKDMDCLPMANQEVTDTSTEGDNFQRTYEALTLENNMLIEQLVHLHCAAEEQKEQLSVLKKDRDLLSFQNGYLHREVANMTADRDNYKRTYETTTLENNDLREQLVHLYCAVEEQKEQLRVLSKDRDILSFQNGYLYREVANISAEKDNFKTAAYKTTTLENNKLREQLVDLRCTVDEAKEELRVTNEYKDLLLSGNKYLHQQVEDISAKMVDLKRRYDAADLENGQLRQRLADLEDALKETAATLFLYLQKKQVRHSLPSCGKSNESKLELERLCERGNNFELLMIEHEKMRVNLGEASSIAVTLCLLVRH